MSVAPSLAVSAALVAIGLLALLLRRDPRLAALLAGCGVLLALATLSRITDDPAAGRAWAVIAIVLLVSRLLDGPRLLDRPGARSDEP